jgi:transposase
VPGVSVSAVARRHDLNANQVFNWRRRYRSDCGSDAAFLPVELVASAGAQLAACAGAGEIEVVLSAGHRVTLRGGFDGDAVARLLRGLVP